MSGLIGVTVPKEELTKKRMGGMGSIPHNLYHVIDCEQIWINISPIHAKGALTPVAPL